MNYHRGVRWQQGSGIGSLFSGIFRGLMPVAKSAIKGLGRIVKSDAVKSAGRTLKKEATKAAVETALDVMDGRPVGARAKERLKTATKGILLQAAKRANNDISSQPTKRKKNTNIYGTRKRRRKQRIRPLFDDDDVY